MHSWSDRDRDKYDSALTALNKSEANCNPDGIIVHSEAKGGDREGIQSSSRLSCGGSQNTSYRSVIGGTFQQGVSSGRHLVGIPGLLAVGGGTNEGRGGHDPETTEQQHRPHRGEGHSGDEKEVV